MGLQVERVVASDVARRPTTQKLSEGRFLNLAEEIERGKCEGRLKRKSPN